MSYTNDQLELLAARDKHDAWLRQQQGFRGCGLGRDTEGDSCLVILSNAMDRQTRRQIELRLQDVKFVFDEVQGDFRAD